jgi:predicted DNA-binding protein (UPF0251 family)
MARPKRLRRLSCAPAVDMFIPSGGDDTVAPEDKIVLTMDEFEALRLADLKCYSHQEAAAQMGVSRATFGRIVESGRSKVARALVHGIRIEITGGAFMFGRGRHLQCPRCKRRQSRDVRMRDHVECRRCCQPLQNSDESRQGPSL